MRRGRLGLEVGLHAGRGRMAHRSSYATRSGLLKILGTPRYRQMTARKLLALMKE